MIGGTSIGEAAIGESQQVEKQPVTAGGYGELFFEPIEGFGPIEPATARGLMTDFQINPIEAAGDTKVTADGDSTVFEIWTIYPIQRAIRRDDLINLDSVGRISESRIAWEADEPEGTDVFIEARLDGGEWIVLDNGGEIEPLNEIDIGLGHTLEIRQRLETTDESITPEIYEVRAEIETE